MKRFSIFLCATVLLATVAVVRAADKRSTEIKTLKDTEARWNKEYETKDVDKVLAHYTDNAVMMTPGEPAAIRKAAIRAALQALISDPALSLHFTASQVEVAKSGEMAYTRGSYTLTVTDPNTKKPVNDKGRRDRL